MLESKYEHYYLTFVKNKTENPMICLICNEVVTTIYSKHKLESKTHIKARSELCDAHKDLVRLYEDISVTLNDSQAHNLCFIRMRHLEKFALASSIIFKK